MRKLSKIQVAKEERSEKKAGQCFPRGREENYVLDLGILEIRLN